MIVAPDFLNHWKTKLLCRLLDDKCAPLYVLRLWEHCHQRRTWVFNVSHDAFAQICHYDGDPEKFYEAMIQTYADQTPEGIVAHGWADANKSLVANWDNKKFGYLGKEYGKLGGRPRREDETTPTEPPTGVSDEHVISDPSLSFDMSLYESLSFDMSLYEII